MFCLFEENSKKTTNRTNSNKFLNLKIMFLIKVKLLKANSCYYYWLSITFSPFSFSEFQYFHCYNSDFHFQIAIRIKI